MGQLTDVDVSVISLVKNGANGEKIQLYKSETPPEANETETPAATDPTAEVEKADTATETTTTTNTGDTKEVTSEAPVIKDQETKNVLAKMFAPILDALGFKSVEKSKDIDNSIEWTSFNSRINNPNWTINDATYTLMYVIEEIFWSDKIENGRELILQNIDEYKAYVSKVLDSATTVQKSFFEKGAEDMKKEDIQEVLKQALEPIETAITSLTAKVDAVEKAGEQQEENPPAADTVEKADETKTEEVAKSDDVVALVKAAIAEGLAPVSQSLGELTKRIETVESVRGLSKSAAGAQDKLEKTGEAEDEWPELKLSF